MKKINDNIIFQKRYYSIRISYRSSKYNLYLNTVIPIILLTIITSLFFLGMPILLKGGLLSESIALALLYPVIFFFLGRLFPYGFGYIHITSKRFIFNSETKYSPFYNPQVVFSLRDLININHHKKNNYLVCTQNYIQKVLNLNGLTKPETSLIFNILKKNCLVQWDEL